MDETKQMIFEETIFPPNQKKVLCLPSSSEEFAPKIFESWIVADELYVKCPACGFVYKLFTNTNVEKFQTILESYSMTYFKRIVNECPNIKMHKGAYEYYV